MGDDEVDFKIDFRRVYFQIFVIGLTTEAFYWSDWGCVDWLILARQFSGLIFLGIGNGVVPNRGERADGAIYDRKSAASRKTKQNL